MKTLQLLSEMDAEQISGGLFWPVPVVEFGDFQFNAGINGDNPVFGIQNIAGDYKPTSNILPAPDSGTTHDSSRGSWKRGKKGKR